MRSTIWFMEGVSSQRDIILLVQRLKAERQLPLTVVASHRNPRNEILSVADYAYIEPGLDDERLSFIRRVVERHGVTAIQTGRNCGWFEQQRAAIEALGVSLTTGAVSPDSLALADDKVKFAALMQQHGLDVVPSLQIDSVAALRQAIDDAPFGRDRPLCIKPVTGIYGMGFWRLDPQAGPLACFSDPNARRVRPDIYLNSLSQAESFAPLVLMPWLPGPERSVDMLVERGRVIAAVGRRKEGALQYMEQHNQAVELARRCAEVMQADGLVNVQTRDNAPGEPLLLEINMRPSGGIGYTQYSGINLPGLFAMLELGLFDAEQARAQAAGQFQPAVVRAISDVIEYHPALSTLLQP
ncbi:carbamoyl-phosphate synthase large chain [Affinibrenneria salicis]|uniref:Carbamoyl-phosphate synthase large chain n=1 Tax=Affinibrenneria salicis TaxID=2590031 RepID=A0A5J5G296_9GAMM|nr:ATP-grasp domain-containing protein [Affinibrenneria salicis]KAA8999997.1 carbamoyl-phosphate synthase large chain [Affinibrenneria salicis]